MHIEYEAKFLNIDKDRMRAKLEEMGAKLVQPEFLQKRVVFRLPKGHEIKGGWIRIRDEGGEKTMSLKISDGKKIEDQKEICLEVNNLKEAELFLTTIGCEKKAYQENKREVWMLNDVKIAIDEWPFLEPFVEIEGKSKEKVKLVSEKLGFDYSKALFCSVDLLYNKKYDVPLEIINEQTPEIIFKGKNPFEKK